MGVCKGCAGDGSIYQTYTSEGDRVGGEMCYDCEGSGRDDTPVRCPECKGGIPVVAK